MKSTMSSLETASYTPLPSDDRKRPLPPVKTFERKTATADEIVATLIQCGGCVIRNAVSPEHLASIEKGTRPFITKDAPLSGSLFPSKLVESLD